MDPSEKPLKTLTLFEMLVALMKDEVKVVLQIKESKKEVTMSSVSPYRCVPVQKSELKFIKLLRHLKNSAHIHKG